MTKSDFPSRIKITHTHTHTHTEFSRVWAFAYVNVVYLRVYIFDVPLFEIVLVACQRRRSVRSAGGNNGDTFRSLHFVKTVKLTRGGRRNRPRQQRSIIRSRYKFGGDRGIVSHPLGSQTYFVDGVETDRPFFFSSINPLPGPPMHRLLLASPESNFIGTPAR